MDKLKMHSPNLTDENVAKIRDLFPGCVTEAADETGKLQLVVDFDQLRQELSDHVVEGPQERYRLDWPGKREALFSANAQIAKTLRPLRSESINFDKTSNLFFEGDNLEVLKLIQESYLGQIKLIYIDPPYNTGSDFIYSDDYAENTSDYLLKTNQSDSDSNRLIANPEANGRFHSDWLSMIYPRIKIAKSLLRDDGVMVISISDREVAALKMICNEIFGETNFIGCVVWNSTKSVTNTALISVGHTYNLIFAKNKNYFVENRSHFRLAEDGSGFSNPDNDPRGPWKADPFQVGGWRPNQQYTITNPVTGEEYKPNPGASWKNDLGNFTKLMSDGRIVFGSSGEAGPQRKRFLSEAEDRGKVSKTWWDDVGTTTNGTASVKKLFGGASVFSNPKPVDLIKRFIELADHTGSGIVLDFFAGSGTTGHAVMELNAEKGANRKFILVQLDEQISKEDKDNEAALKYLLDNSLAPNIAEITKCRLKLAARELQKNTTGQFDDGFRAFKLSTSNMRDTYYSPDSLNQGDLLSHVDNIKQDRSHEDLLFQTLIDWGADLALPIRREAIHGKTVFFVDDNALAACFDSGVTEELVKELAGHMPLRMVFRDNGFVSDAVKINVEQIFRQLSPNTDIKSI
jgi:adenine-specific DNA-methyltransferase